MINLQSPFVQGSSSVSTIMLLVLLTLLPGLFLYIHFFGLGILLNVLIATITAIFAEFIILKIRKLPAKIFLTDYTAVVTAWLLALSIPSIAPWWITVLGTLFAIVVAKHFYGGIGSNLFNPAMIGYAILLISFPAVMTKWQNPSHINDIELSLSILLAGIDNYDAIASATPLDYLKTELLQGKNVSQIMNEPIAKLTQMQWVSFGFFIGGIILLLTKVITWHLPLTYLVTLFVIASIFHLIDPNQFAPFQFHLLNGGTMLAAFFIITDPVSGPTTPNGKIFFAILIATLVYVIRVFGGYPEGIAFAVIFANICVPLIDNLTQPKVFGHE
ncbi:MAG: RnfABCDGE type electron transport complex subunit D [Methylophilaceae bacterium]